MQDVSQLKSSIKYLERSLKRDDRIESINISRVEHLWSKVNHSAWLARGLSYYEYCDLKSSAEKIIEDGRRRINEQSLQENDSLSKETSELVPNIGKVENLDKPPKDSIEPSITLSSNNVEIKEENLPDNELVDVKENLLVESSPDVTECNKLNSLLETLASSVEKVEESLSTVNPVLHNIIESIKEVKRTLKRIEYVHSRYRHQRYKRED